MIELIIIIGMLICNLIIVDQWARFGLLESTIRYPSNRKLMTAAVVGAAIFGFSGILKKYAGVEFNYLREDMFLRTGLFLFGIPAGWYLLRRVPAQLSDQRLYDKTIARVRYWTLQYYKPGISLGQANLLASFPMAASALVTFDKLIEGQTAFMSKPANKKNVATALEEKALLYRMMNRFDEAQEALEGSLKIVDELMEEFPEDSDYGILKSLVLFRQAEAYHASGTDLEKAKRLYQESIDLDSEHNSGQDSALTIRLLEQLS